MPLFAGPDEHSNFITSAKPMHELIYYLPISRYFKKDNLQYQQDVEGSKALEELWQKKYKVELLLAILFIVGLLCISIIEY